MKYKLLEIKTLEKKEYSGPTYDIEVNENHSYNIDGIIVHNSVCETKNVTGVNTPMFTTIERCATATDKPIIADGGARAYGDVAKAIGAGATAVMSGYFFAGCPENPERARIYDSTTHSYKPIYRGMASRDAMAIIREVDKPLPTPEGRSTTTNLKPSAKVVVEEIAGGLRSAFSYVGARNFDEFQAKVRFGYRH
jgi:IMP dehydrogenase